MTNRTGDVAFDDFDQGWLEVLDRTPFVRLVYGLGGLTRLGERPARLDRLAHVVGASEEATAALVQENTTAHIENGLVFWDDPFPGTQARRMLYVGDRAIAMKSGCAPDLPLFAAVLDVGFRVEDHCASTGVAIRIEFVPDGFETVDPPESVTVLLPVDQLEGVTGWSFEQIDRNVCTHQPFFASAQAAEGWQRANPGGRVLTIAEMFDLPWYRYFRDTLRPLIHPSD